VNLHSVAGVIGFLQAGGAHVNVLLPGLKDVTGHALESARAVSLERDAAMQDPGTEDQVGVAQGVVGVQVGEEDDFQVLDVQRLDAVLLRRFRPLHHARPAIHQVGGAVHHDGHGCAGAVGIRFGRARAQHHHLGMRRGRGLGGGSAGENEGAN